MCKSLKILFLTALLPYTNLVSAQTLSNRGREFWVGYGHHQFMETNNGQEMILYFSAEEAAHVIVTINGTTYKEEYDVPANSVIPGKLIPKGLSSIPASIYDARLYTRPPSFPGGTGSEGVFKKQAIHIESDVPIVAYAHIYGDLSSGATMLMPVETWGHSYISVNTPQYYNNSNFNCFSWMYVVAKQNNTRIRIVPTVNTRQGDLARVPIIVNLQKGEIYQLVGAPITSESGQNVAGSTVTSIENDQGECYPIALFSGSSRTQITCLNGTGSGDNIMQQAFPLQAWGKRYLTTPTSVDNSPKIRNINVFRIIVKDASTVVKKNGQQLVALNTQNGFYYEYQSNTPDFIEADKPVLVAQYIPSQNSCTYSGVGDPEMIFISPIEQSIKRIGFYRNTKESISVNYLSLIIPTNGITSLSIDGVLGGFSDQYPHPNYAGYSVVVKRWVAAQAQCIVQSDSAFTAITYGLGGAESYGYNAGTYINNLNGFAAIKNQFSTTADDNSYTCENTPVQLSVLMRYQPTQLKWLISSLAGKIIPATDVVQNNPVPSGTQVNNGIIYYRYQLPGNYMFSQAGEYSIPLFATSPLVETCNQTEEVQYTVEVKPALKTGFQVNYQNCSLSENIQFVGSDTFTTGDSIKNWTWLFSDNQTAIGKNVSHVFAAGNHAATLQAINEEGCIADTTRMFTLSAKPANPKIQVISNDSCAGVTMQFKDENPEAGIKQWFWDFGTNDTVTTAGSSLVSRQFLQNDTIQVKLVAKFSATCVSDTGYKMVVIYANPSLALVNPSGCMPTNGNVVFVNNSTIKDGQTMLSHSWNFGDTNATASNPNTSLLKSPAHIYTAAGNYQITYKAITEKGCMADSSFTVSLYPIPNLAYPIIPSLCENSGKVSIALAFDVNNITGSGIYVGTATTTVGVFDAALAGPGVHRIQYVFTTPNACKDSVAQTVTVHLQPVIDAGRSFVVKEGTMVQFEATANDTSFSFSWTPATGLDNANILRPRLTVMNDAIYALTATGENNCTALDTMSVTVQKTIFIPNAFSPNGDGINDVWQIKNIEQYRQATIDIYDRYGSVIYKTTGTSKPWDGTIQGKQVPLGTYYFIINLKNGEPAKSGSVTLIR